MNTGATARGRAVKLLSDGFLRPPVEGVEEIADAQQFIWMSVEGLSEPLQYFHCRVTRGHDHSTVDYILVDDGPADSRSAIELFLANRFPGSTCVFLCSQRTGRARVECPTFLTVEEDAAAAVAVVMCSAAWDESEVIAVTANSNEYKISVELIDDTHWATQAQAPSVAAGAAASSVE
jgi:hypothetical protein